MTNKEVAEMVAEIGLPYAYYEFPDDTEQVPPFVCFFYPDDDDFMADNENYVNIRRLVVELYSDEKRFDLEDTVKSVLNSHGLTFAREETYISAERMWQVTFDMEVIING